MELGFGGHPPPFEYLNDLYPGYFGPILLQHPEHDDEFEIARAMFGIVPQWAKLSLARDTYNARSETVHQKPSFRSAWKNRRFCLVPVDHFFEPKYDDNGANPVRWKIFRKDGKPFCFAGIWELCPSKDPDNDPRPLRSFSMLTINADGHPIMQQFHAPGHEKRSPVVIDPDDYHAWLNAKSDEEARSFLKLFDADEFDSAPAPRPPRVSKKKAQKPPAASGDS